MPRTSTTWTQRPPGAGRRKGPSKKQIEIKDFFKSFYNSTEYREKLKERIMKGKAMPIEMLGYHYVYGKPKERVQLLGAEGEAITHDDLIAALVTRFTRLAATRVIGQGAAETATGATGGPVLELVRAGQAEPAPTNGTVDHLVTPGGTWVREDENGSGNDQAVGDGGG